MKGSHKIRAALPGLPCLALALSGCAGVQTSKLSYSDSYQVNQPVKTEGCYDASVVLAKSLGESKEMAKKVLIAIDSTLTHEAETQLNAQRNRTIGLLVGSGGEELSVTLKPVSSDKTFVTATTKTGFVGGAGQKAWSCQIVDELAAMASRSR